MPDANNVQPYDWRSMTPVEAQMRDYTLRIVATGPMRVAMTVSWEDGSKGFVQGIRPALHDGKLLISYMQGRTRIVPRAKPGTASSEVALAEQRLLFGSVIKDAFAPAISTHMAFSTVEAWRVANVEGKDPDEIEKLWGQCEAAFTAMEIAAPDVDLPISAEDRADMRGPRI